MQTVLVVDDSQHIRGAIKDFLHYWQPTLRVLEAKDGEEGFKLARTHHPDIILLDMRMPHMNGDSAAHELKHAAETINIPVIGITADMGYNAQLKLVAEPNCQAFLQKPFDPNDLFSLLTNLTSAV